jgi:hypothetical protein
VQKVWLLEPQFQARHPLELQNTTGTGRSDQFYPSDHRKLRTLVLEFKGSIRPQNGAIPVGGRTPKTNGTPDASTDCDESGDGSVKTHILEAEIAPASYTNGSSHARASSSLAASSSAARR